MGTRTLKRPKLSGPLYGYLGKFRKGGIPATGHNPGLRQVGMRKRRVVREPMTPQGPAVLAPGRMVNAATVLGAGINTNLRRALRGAAGRLGRARRRMPPML